MHLGNQVAKPLSLRHQNLACQQVKRLDLRGAFIDQRDPAVPHQLFNAGFPYEPVAAEHLHCIIYRRKPAFGEKTFYDRRQEIQQLLGTLTHRVVPTKGKCVHTLARKIRQRPPPLDEGPLCQQHATDIRMHHDRVRRLVRISGTGK